MTLEQVKELFQTAELQELCRENGVARLSVFGSTARHEATEESDLDLLISFSKRIGLWELIAFEDKLAEATKHKVDLVTEGSLKGLRAESIRRDLQVVYSNVDWKFNDGEGVPLMGDVKVKVKQVRSVELEGIVDTGAVALTLPSHIVEKLGLTRRHKQVAQYADGRLKEVDVTEPVFVELTGRYTSEEALVLGDEILIGQTVLEKTDLFVDCRAQRLIPNPAHPNQPVQKVR